MDINGSISLIRTAIENNGIDSDTSQERYSLRLSQALAPFLDIQLGYSLRDFDSQTAGADPFSRRSELPSLDLRYRRPEFSASLSLAARTTDTSTPSQDLESDSLIARFNWRPTSALSLFGRFLDSSTVADVAVFGRESKVVSYGAGISFEGRFLSTGYSFDRSEFDSKDRFSSQQDRHKVFLEGGHSFLDNRLSLNFFSNLSRVERQDDVVEGAELVTPVPALQGLFAVDTSPEIGELEASPDLIDGDTITPVFPSIDIGGAATFRSIGLDLGINTPVTRLEITVDTLSGRDVSWRVYAGPDNFVWNPVDGVIAVFDEALLRYTLRFPETTSRYLKAVNVSANPEPVVRVTELRALVDVEPSTSDSESSSDRYRYGVSASYKPADWLRIGAEAGGSNDEDVGAGLVRRDYTERHHGAEVSIWMPQNLTMLVSYRFEDIEDLREPILLRTIETYSARLNWSPLETLDAVLTVGRREETDDGELLQLNESVGLRVVAELLPTLRSTTDLRVSDLTDEVSDLGRETRSFEQRFETEPLTNWTLGGSYRYTTFEGDESFPLDDQQRINLFTRWSVSPYLSLGGTWSWLIDEETSLQQSYNLLYTPGKLTLGGNFQESTTRNGLSTQLATLTTGYRLNRHFRLDTSFTQSQTKGREVTTTENTTLTGRLRMSF